MADLNSSNSQESLNEVENGNDLNKCKLIQSSNKQRLLSFLEKQKVLCADKEHSKDFKCVETGGMLNNTISSDSNSSAMENVNMMQKISRPQDEMRQHQESSPSKMNCMESSNALESLSSDFAHSNLDDLLDLSDSEDVLCAMSLKKDEDLSDNDEDETFIKFSTQLQHSDTKYLDFNDQSLWKKQKVPALQIGVGIPEPVLSAEAVGFSKHVLRVLKEINFFGPSCVQSVVWPSMDRGRSVVVIAPPHSGKTVSYVLPLVSRFTSGKISEENTGPASIILCSTWIKAQAVHDYFNLFFDNFRVKIVTICTESGCYKNKMQSVINRCDILIATPHCLLQILRERNISFARLEGFILDDGTIIMDKNKKEVVCCHNGETHKSILAFGSYGIRKLKEIVLRLMEARNRAECNPQFIICAERWDKNFQLIIDKVMPSPVLFFTSFLEAAVYAKVPIYAHVYTTVGEKKMALLGMLKKAGKVIICTTNTADSLEIHHFLKRFQYKSYLVNEEVDHYSMKDTIKTWKSDTYEFAPLSLVITDQCLIEMPISNANCLIHYDIPSKSRLQFGNRFSCIAEHLAEEGSGQLCVCHVLLMESEYHLVPHLIEIVENCGTPSEKLLELSQKRNQDEVVSGDLCHYMKAFGCCSKPDCKSRHTVDPAIDKPKILPCEGDFHGLVTHIIDASHFYARGIKYLDPVSNNTVSLNATYAKIGFQLRDFYIQAPEDMKVKTPVVGESYVLTDENKVFYRVKVLEFFPETTKHLAQWKILYLDEGWIKHTSKLNLYKLTDQIKLPEPLAVEIYLCNVITPDSCLDWNPQTSQLVSDLIKGKEIHGKIVLCIGKTLWMEPLAVTVKLPDGNYVYPFKVNQKLYEFGHARKNNKHIMLLYKACTDKISLPHIAKPKIKEEKVVEEKPLLKYAFLECNVFEDVYVSSVVSPHQLYVQRAKFVECLDDLLEKINAQVEKRKLKKACTIYKEMLSIAPFHEDNRYYRAVVTDIISHDEIQLFFVDFGDTGKALRKNIYSLPEEFLVLPFQAIECELAGITAPHGGWSECAVNTLTTKTRDESYDMKVLLLKAYSKKNCYAGGNHYVIDLWDGEKKISEQLLQAGFALPSDIVDTPTNEYDNSTQSNNEAFNLNDEFSSSSEDEDLDPEDKEITARFYGALAKMVAEEFNLFPKPTTTGEVSSDEEEILKKCKAINVPLSDENCNNFQNLLPNLAQFKEGESSSKTLNSVRPLINWWDTPEELNILIMLKDIKIYELDLLDEGLSFNTIIAGVQYSTEEKFYEKVNSQDAKTCHSIQGINIVVKKHTPFKWPRLTKEKKKFFHIKYDLLHIDDSDNEEPSKDIDKERMRYLYDDKESTSTDEEETYVEPWKEFAQTKDIYHQLM